MKNVRLFAVAAALGMFASTVAAADTKANVTWSTEDAVIKVDLGDQVYLPTVTASYSLTDAKHETGSYYGMAEAGSWYYTSAKLWTSTEDAVKDLSLGGLRFLAPGAAEVEDVFVDAEGTVYADFEEAYDALVKNGKVTEVKNSDGDVTQIVLNFTDTKAPNAIKPATLTQNYVTVGSGKKDYEKAKEAVVSYLVDGNEAHVTDALVTPYYQNAYTPKTYWAKDTELKAGDIVFVSYNKKGVATFKGIGTFANKSSKQAGVAVAATDLKAGANFDVDAEFATETYEKLVAGTTYYVTYTVKTTDDTTKAFTKSDVQFVKRDTTYAAYDETHRFMLNTSDSDVNALVFVDVDGNDHIVKLTDSSLKYLDADTSTWKSLKTLDLNNAANLTALLESDANGHITLSYDGVLLASHDANIDDSFDYEFLADAEYDYVVKGEGYNKITPAMAKALGDTNVTFTVDGGKTIVNGTSNISADNAVLRAAVASDWNYISALGAKDKITVVEVDSDFDITDYYEDVAPDASKSITKYSDVRKGAVAEVAGTAASTYAVGTYASQDGAHTVVVVSSANQGLTVGKNYKELTAEATPTVVDYGTTGAQTIASGYYSIDSGAVAWVDGFTTTDNTKDGSYVKYTEGTSTGTIVAASAGTPANSAVNDAAREEDASKAFTITPEFGKKGELATKYVLDDEVQNFVEVLAPTSDNTGAMNKSEHMLGMYEVDAPANDTEFYVLLVNNKDVTGGVNLTDLSWSRSTSKMKGYYDDKDGNEVETELAYLDKEYYPAFATLEDLEKFVARQTGLDTALVGTTKTSDSAKSFYKWYNTNGNAANYKLLTGETAPTSATYDTEKLAEGETKAATVTSDVDSIDFNTAGVKVVTYTAKDADGKELATNKLTVVVAPKYTRTWENGRVKTLKSYYVTKPSQVYVEYSYNWTAKTVTYTYYNEDGSVAATGENSLN